MRPFDEALAAARAEPAFSNSTDGDAWMDAWCQRCRHDVDADGVDGEGCPLVLVALMGRTPSEWLQQDDANRRTLADAYHCVEFRDRHSPGPGYELPPSPPLPGQEALFPAEPFTGVRMFEDSVIRPERAGAR